MTDMPVAEIPVEALESVDLDVPGAFLDEIMAAEMMGLLSEYHKTVNGASAARHVGDHQRAEALTKQEAFLRAAIARIQHFYPNAKGIAASGMNARAKQRVNGK